MAALAMDLAFGAAGRGATMASGQSSLRRDRARRGQVSYHAGLAAEDSVAALYARRGHAVLAQRWRGRSGEIDLILRDGDGIIVVEVKKGRSFGAALGRITQAQIARITGAVGEFVETRPGGAFTEVRFDVALVDGGGQIEILENFWP